MFGDTCGITILLPKAYCSQDGDLPVFSLEPLGTANIASDVTACRVLEHAGRSFCISVVTQCAKLLIPLHFLSFVKELIEA